MRLIVILFVLIIYLSNAPCTFAKDCVNIIYLHGFNAFDYPIVEDEAKRVAQAFQGRCMGNYCFSGKYRLIFWADLYDCDEAFKLYESALMSLNNTHNHTNPKIHLSMDQQKFNLFSPLIHPSDRGSGPVSSYLRNLINGFLFQIFFLKTSPYHQNIVMDRIQKAIDTTNCKFVIIAHSFGSAAAVDFLETRIISNPANEQKFAGLITSADLTTTFNANYWAQNKDYDPLKKIAQFIVQKDKFWICYNHRNDIAATGLPKKLTDYKKEHNLKGKGFIVSKTTKSAFLNNYTSFLRPFALDNGKIRAHSWLHLRPYDFADKVIKTYEQEH